jgi:nucleoside-diphosphate-sugar epimerase
VGFDVLEDLDALTVTARDAQAILCLSGVTPAHAQRTGDGMHLNSELALAAVRGAERAAVPRVFLASSAAVYGHATGLLDEEIQCEPVSEYGKSKLEMESVALARGVERGVEVCCLRIGNVAGADAILGGWRDGFALDRLPDGTTPRRSYIGPKSLAKALHALTFAKQVPAHVNVAAPGTVEMGAILDAAALPWNPRNAGSEVIAEVSLATGRLSQHITLDPEASTPAGLVAEWAEFKAQEPQTA